MSLETALGSGWLIPIIVALIGTTVLPLCKWIASKWRKPLLEEIALREELKADVKEVTADLKTCNEQLSREQVMRMFLEQQARSQEKELENWRSGRYRSNA